MCEFGLPPSKFRVSFLNYFTCELVRLHLNAIAAQSRFSVLCECWLDIPLDTSLF
jgi:hypothetical protein